MELFIFLPLIIVIFGFFLWKIALNNYGYNIFGVGVLVRLLIAGILIFIEPYSGFTLLVIFSIWNFFVTWRNTSFIIALFAVFLQPVALILAIEALNKLIKTFDE